MNFSIDKYDKANSNRIEAEVLAKILCEYDVISFDLFDTLVLRPFTSPRVLFSIMESRLGIYKFAKIRIDSENEIRKFNNDKYHYDTATLDEIYELIYKKTNLEPKLTSQLEYNLEINYCYANPYFEKVLSLCRKYNKKMVICSDMYLNGKQIAGLLEKVGFGCFDDILVSSELKKSKKKGDIYTVLKEKYKNSKIIHIGDNYISDFINPQNYNIDAYHYENINEIGGKNRVDGMSYITGRVYSALINNHFYCDLRNYDDEYKLGYIYGGIYVLGFVQWINNFTRDHNIDKVLFLSRDGDVYSKMFNMLPNHKQWEYFYWSRIAGVKITAMENFYEFCQRMIWHKARGVYHIKIKHILDFFGIDYLVNKLDAYNVSKDDLLTIETAPGVEKLFYDYKADILFSFKGDIDATIEKVKTVVGNAHRIAVVDVGWAGTGPLIIKNIVNKYLSNDCKVFSLLAGYRQPIENMAALYTMDNSICSYLFSDVLNRDLLEQHVNYGSKKNNLLLEIFSQSCSPSFLGYTNNGLVFDREEYQNYEVISKINCGIEAFVKNFIETFKNDPFIMNVSPYDAYMPFNEMKNSSHLLDEILSKLVISRGLFYDNENVSEETWLSFLYKDES